MEENSNKKSTYQVVDMSEKGNKKSNHSFSRSVFIPFCSGAIGAVIVVGTCFGIPQIRDNILPNIGYVQTSITSDNKNTTPSALSQVSLKNYSETGMNVASKVRPSIVGIKVEYTANSIFLRNPTTAQAEGSGIIISEDGYILTNNHIVNSSSNNSYYEIEQASKVSVFLYNDETEYPATIIGTDEQTDLAVIKIDKTGLAAAELGNSDNVQVGEFSMAIGNPLGLESSVTAGIISAVNRKVTDSDGKTFTLIQTDAAINSGNSGGALANSKGQIIGINTLKMSGSGIEGMGFAIPINLAKPIYEQLIQYNKVKRPYIGLSGRDLDEQTAKANNLVVGVYVLSVEEFSAAEKAGIKIGDVITSIDGKKIKTMDELNEIKNTHAIGDEIKLTIYRNNAEKEISVTLQEQ